MQPIGALMSQTWAFYKERFWTLIGIAAIPQVVMLLLTIVGGGTILGLLASGRADMGILLLILYALVGSLVFLVVISWSQIALVLAIKDHIGVKEAYSRAWGKILAYWWVVLLSSLIIWGALVMFFIPGVMVGVWFFMSLYVLLAEDKKGMASLYTSREYVRGHWWPAFWRIVLLCLGIMIPSMILSVIPFAQPVFTVLLTPFAVIYTYFMYKNLKEMKGGAVAAPTSGENKFYWIAGILGAITMVALILMMFMGVGFAASELQKMESNDGELPWEIQALEGLEARGELDFLNQ